MAELQRCWKCYWFVYNRQNGPKSSEDWPTPTITASPVMILAEINNVTQDWCISQSITKSSSRLPSSLYLLSDINCYIPTTLDERVQLKQFQRKCIFNLNTLHLEGIHSLRTPSSYLILLLYVKAKRNLNSNYIDLQDGTETVVIDILVICSPTT